MASLLRLPRLVSVGLPVGLLTRISLRGGLRRTGEAAPAAGYLPNSAPPLTCRIWPVTKSASGEAR